MFSRLAAFSFVALFLCSCGDRESRIELQKKAALKCLNEYFTGNWHIEKVYIERSEYLPARIDRIGDYDAEVIAQEELAVRMAERSVASTMAIYYATVGVYEYDDDPDNYFHVSISASDMPPAGANALPLGGGMDYTFKIEDGKPVLVDSGKWME